MGQSPFSKQTEINIDSETQPDLERYLARLLPSSTIAAIANPATA